MTSDLTIEAPKLDWQHLRGLPLSEIKVGMKLRHTHDSTWPDITVTGLTERGFKYTHPRHSLGPRYGWVEGGECYGHDGYSYYKAVDAPINHHARYEYSNHAMEQPE